jgi:hypothetical protein
METIAKNEYYAVEVDPEKNRLYLRGKGFWGKVEIAQRFIGHVQEGIQQLSKGYSVLADLHDFKTPPFEVGELIIEGQKIAADTSGKNAQVLGENQGIAMPLSRYAKTSGIHRQIKSFATREEAEAWLDAG